MKNKLPLRKFDYLEGYDQLTASSIQSYFYETLNGLRVECRRRKEETKLTWGIVDDAGMEMGEILKTFVTYRWEGNVELVRGLIIVDSQVLEFTQMLHSLKKLYKSLTVKDQKYLKALMVVLGVYFEQLEQGTFSMNRVWRFPLQLYRTCYGMDYSLHTKELILRVNTSAFKAALANKQLNLAS
jgi:hypothetical protein